MYLIFVNQHLDSYESIRSELGLAESEEQAILLTDKLNKEIEQISEYEQSLNFNGATYYGEILSVRYKEVEVLSEVD